MGRFLNNSTFASISNVFLLSLFAKALAFIQEVIIAALVGTSEIADAYYMTNSIMQIFWSFLSVGISRVFLPEYKKSIVLGGKTAGEEYANNMMTLMFIASVLLTIITFVLAPFLVRLFAYGFSDEAKRLCVEFARLRAPQYVFWCFITIISAMLQSNEKFVGSKIHELTVHIPVIIVALLLFDRCGIYAILAGVLLGSLIGLLTQIPFLSWGHRFRLKLINGDEIKESIRRMPAAFASAAIVQIHSFVDKVMGSMQPIGAISALSYGGGLYNAASGLVSSAFATVAFPKISEFAVKDDLDRLNHYVIRVLKALWIIAIPASIALTLYAKQLVSILYERGSFDSSDTLLVAGVFAAYSFGLFFSGTSQIINLVLFGYGDTKTPMLVSLSGIIINIILNYIFVDIIGTPGLALASSFSNAFICVISIQKSKAFLAFWNREIVCWLLRTVSLSLLICLVSYMPVAMNWTKNLIINLCISTCIGSLLYVPFAWLMVPSIRVRISTLKRNKNDKNGG